MMNSIMNLVFLRGLGGSADQVNSCCAGGKASNPDIATMLSSALGQSLFEPRGGGANMRDGNNPLFKLIADFMDKSPEKYGAPHDANGRVRNWSDELGEDKYLNAEEKRSFEKGLKGFIQELLAGGGATGGVDGGRQRAGWPSPGNGNGPSSMPTLGQNGESSAARGQAGGMGGGLQGVMDGVLGLLSGVLANSVLGGLMQAFADPLKAGSGLGKSLAGGGKDDILKEITRFMDMNANTFGKPQGLGGDWMSQFSKGGGNACAADCKQLQKAIGLVTGGIQDVLQGRSATGGASGGQGYAMFDRGLRADAYMAAESVMANARSNWLSLAR